MKNNYEILKKHLEGQSSGEQPTVVAGTATKTEAKTADTKIKKEEEEKATSGKPETKQTPDKKELVEEEEKLVNDYNNCSVQKDKDAFINGHNAKRFGLTEDAATARRQKPETPPAFNYASGGDMLAIEGVWGKIPAIYTVPRFDLVFQETNYKTGAMKNVFECPNFVSGKRYTVKVEKPAIFKKSGNELKLLEKGKLTLYEK